MLHHHTIWKLMRKYSQRQVESDSVEIVADYLEQTIANIIAECEKLLLYHGTKKTRISVDCVKSVIKDKRHTALSQTTGGNEKRKEENILHSPNEVV